MTLTDTIPTPGTAPDRHATLDAEWARIAALLELTEAMQAGRGLEDAFETRFSELQAEVESGRMAGAWSGLRAVLSEADLSALMPFDLDLLALALAPHARPALAARMHGLQPLADTGRPALPLVQDLLMLDKDVELALLHHRLAPDAVLVARDLLRLTRQGEYLCLEPGPAALREMLSRPGPLGPPPGADAVAASGSWDDLVVARQTAERLRELSGWICARQTVFGDWQARRVGGPIALFSGPSGVGKSFAAEVLTAELGRESGMPWALYRLDLGRIVSKYVGETEKNLNALLDALDGAAAVLQIDEADGLLGKRGEVSDARDRYANLEVSHMLSRFERHDGPVILTTNLRGNIDAAFLRRFQIVVDFEMPDADMRAALWQRLMPPHAPTDALDLAAIAAALPLTGGAIQNVAILAAARAARGARAIGYGDIARAAWLELGKEARKVRPAELGFLAAHLPEAS